jgi:hypothetical protein
VAVRDSLAPFVGSHYTSESAIEMEAAIIASVRERFGSAAAVVEIRENSTVAWPFVTMVVGDDTFTMEGFDPTRGRKPEEPPWSAHVRWKATDEGVEQVLSAADAGDHVLLRDPDGAGHHFPVIATVPRRRHGADRWETCR